MANTLVSLATAFLLGALVGFERQVRQRTAGLRTNVLVAVGAAIFVDLAFRIAGPDGGARVISYVVSGVGFLGAGAIMREGGSIRGLNTAATLWGSAAIGACAAAPLRRRVDDAGGRRRCIVRPGGQYPAAPGGQLRQPPTRRAAAHRGQHCHPSHHGSRPATAGAGPARGSAAGRAIAALGTEHRSVRRQRCGNRSYAGRGRHRRQGPGPRGGHPGGISRHPPGLLVGQYGLTAGPSWVGPA
ncbi:MgtC/SapB family protein [Bordetella holmesii]|nr:magnesium transporter ATPase [Bordetella holmesii]AWP94767.1 magnesium transporter ATPase [Bordetella holmesii]QGB09208.1 MgtC/SapB family protein [Bordetella holmesii]QGB16615.1 MgtC/SapB family protein [Bordetella holmesii]QGB65856.1 MgtC/SapB family protein [Bordetella holmesii]